MMLPRSLFAVAILLLSGTGAFAQSLRAWVASSGDDANPGTIAQPVRSFQAAHNLLSSGGEIACLDAANFGPLAISKSVTIDGAGVLAGISSTQSIGVLVTGPNSGSPINVILRNLAINGHEASNSSDLAIGVRVTGAATVRIENCQIYGFDNAGIEFRPNSSDSTLYVHRSSVHNCQEQGILVDPDDASCTATITDSTVSECEGAGVRAQGSCAVLAKQVHCSGNSAGFSAGAGSALTVSQCTANFNQQGIVSAGLVELIQTDVVRNTSNGLLRNPGGVIRTNKNNRIFGNGVDGTPNGTVTFK